MLEISKTKNLKLKTLHHIDLYRLENEDSVRELGLSDLFQDPETVVIIEWAEKLGKLTPKKRLDVRFEFVNGSSRKISIFPQVQS